MTTPNTIIPELALGNDLAFVAQLYRVVAGELVPADPAGSAQAFWTDDPESNIPIDALLTVDVTFMHDELWEVKHDADDDKDSALVAVLSNGQSVYLVLTHDDGIRAVARCVFSTVRYARVLR